jgi:acetyl esterase/lipase
MRNNLFIILVTCGYCFVACKYSPSHETPVAEEALVGDQQSQREETLAGMQEAMGKLPDFSNLPPLDPVITDSLNEDFYTRYTISFTAAENEQVPAYLYVPHQDGQKERRAAMLVLHGTGEPGKRLVDGESPRANRAHAKELAERGYIVIAPDYPGMGELKDYDFANDRYESGTMKAIFNHMRCVDLLQEMNVVDPERIGVIGHSLGGHNSMFVGAFDPRLKVIVSSCGWTPMNYYREGNLAPWAQELYMPSIRDRYNLDPEKVPFDFDGIIASLAPRAFFSNSPINDDNFEVEGVKKGIASAKKFYAAMGAEDNLQVRYPDAGHDFPVDVRIEAYEFIDKALNHTPNHQELQ